MKKRIIFLTAMLCLGLTACGKTEKTESVNPQDSTEQASQESDSGTVSLTVWGAEEDQDLLNKMVQSFEEEYKGVAKFDITVAAQGESTCKDTLLGDVQSGADVFTFVDDQLKTMVAAGVLQPVEDDDTVKSENLEAAVEASTVNDTLYAYPMTADNGYFMYYNKDYFTDEDVQTLDQMLNVAAANGKKVAMDWTSGWYLYSFFGNTGMELGLNDDGISNCCTWNATDGQIKGVDVANAMLTIAANPGFGNMTDSDFIEGVKNGSVIAGVSGVWDANGLKEVWGDSMGATKLPTYTCAGQQVQMSSFSGYKMVGVNAYSKHVDWASKLAEWITNEQNQTLRFEERGQGPSNKKASESDAVKQTPAIQAVMQQAEFSNLQRIGEAYWEPVTDFGTTMAALNPSGMDLQEYMDKMVKEITASNAK